MRFAIAVIRKQHEFTKTTWIHKSMTTVTNVGAEPKPRRENPGLWHEINFFEAGWDGRVAHCRAKHRQA
jgi:hypothetical protein